VIDLTGAEWRVGRVWLGRAAPRFRRMGKKAGGDVGREASAWVPFDLGSWGDVEAVLAVVVVLLLIVFVIIPLLLFGADLVIVGGALAASITGRLLLGRPWTVQAECVDGHHELMSWSVSGWRRSRLAIEEIAQAIAAGSQPHLRE
jgi:hypothetical protein